MRKRLLNTVTIVILATANPIGAHAGEILTATGVISNTMGDASEIPNLLTQTGLSSNYVSGVTNFNTFVQSGVVQQAYTGGWESAILTTSGSLVFDLGAVYNLSEFVMWNGGTTGYGTNIDSFSVYTSTNANMEGATFAGSFTGQDSTFAANVYDLVDTNAEYVELEINSDFGYAFHTTLGNIAFDVTAVGASDPDSLVVLGVGLLGLGVARHRRLTGRREGP